MSNMFRNLDRYFYFFHYTKKTQIIGRFISLLSRPISHRIIRGRCLINNNQFNYFKITNKKIDSHNTDILNNQFNFLSTSHAFVGKIKWKNNGQNDLWNFNLNYFDYLNDLIYFFKVKKSDEYLNKGIELVQDWIDTSSKYNRVIWSPYTISLRLLNWITFYSFLIEIGFLFEIPRNVLTSIIKQVNYLKFNLEYDVRGNHLFENIKTVILVEFFLNNKEVVEKYIKKLIKEFEIQILSDGCHFEKSISYHIILMIGTFNIISIVNYDIDSMKTLKKYAKIMYEFYDNIRYSDKDYPLFNDSNFTMTDGIICELSNIKTSFLSDEKPDSIKTLKTCSNYYSYRTDRLCLTMDLGNLGSNYLLAHSHNDINNFELLVDNNKIITDTGVFEYERSKERNYSRSTRAHNTVQINGFEQSDIWGSFRNGYRPTKYYVETDTTQSYKRFTGSYKYKNKYTHERSFFITSNDTIVVFDNLKLKQEHSAKSYLHFSPEVTVRSKKNHVEIFNDQFVIYLYIFNRGKIDYAKDVDIFDSEYYPNFGSKYIRKSLVYQSKSSQFGYIISVNIIEEINLNDNILKIKYQNGIFEIVEIER